MCGLLGMMGPGIQVKDYKILRELGFVSQIRGIDGAGIYQVRSQAFGKNAFKYEQIYKSPENWSSMMTEIDEHHGRKDKDYADLLKSTMADVLMCHVRWATKGHINEANAHPFNTYNIVGAHNGTLVDKKYEDNKKTDSELLFLDINHRMQEKKGNILDVLNDLDVRSAYAITMYNRADHKMYFARNGARDLAFAFLKDRGVMYWASDIGMLRYILGRNGEGDANVMGFASHQVITVSSSDVTMANIKKDPTAYVWKHFGYTNEHPEMKKQVPVVVQEETNRERLDREERLNFTPQSGGTTNKGGVWSPDFLSQDVNGEPERWKTPMGESVVIPFNKQAAATGTGNRSVPVVQPEVKIVKQPVFKHQSIKTFWNKCRCEKKRFNLFESDRCRRGLLKGFSYDEKHGEYYCDNCKPEAKVG
jgi:predicted glutamine amidotransferase